MVVATLELMNLSRYAKKTFLLHHEQINVSSAYRFGIHNDDTIELYCVYILILCFDIALT